MKLKPYVDKLNSSKEYRAFQKKHKDAFIIAGFFILDFEDKHNTHQIDYYIPSEKKVAAFTLDNGVNLQILSSIGGGKPEELDIKTKIDLDALHGILQDEMKNRSMTEDIKKIIAILQRIEGKKIWNLNCILSGMEILKAHIDDDSKTILKMEKLSLFDLMKKMPQYQLDRMKKMGGAQLGKMPEEGAQGEEVQEEQMNGQAEAEPMPMQKESPEMLKQKVKKLEMLEKAVETEKQKAEIELLKMEKAKAKPKKTKK